MNYMDEARKALMTAVEDVLYETDLSLANDDTLLKDLGANSIDRVDIIITAMNNLGIRCDLMSFQEARSIGEISEILAAQRA